MTRSEIDDYFAQMMGSKKFKTAILDYLALVDMDAGRNFKNEAMTDGERAYFQGVGKTVDAIRKYFESRIATQKAVFDAKTEPDEEY
jgi:hypothetical protein